LRYPLEVGPYRLQSSSTFALPPLSPLLNNVSFETYSIYESLLFFQISGGEISASINNAISVAVVIIFNAPVMVQDYFFGVI